MNYTNIIEKENSIILENVKDFNIKQILECGQCFRWERMTDTDYIIVAYRRVIEVIQEGSTVTILNTNMKDFNEIWKQYFDLEVNYGEIKEELYKNIEDIINIQKEKNTFDNLQLEKLIKYELSETKDKNIMNEFIEKIRNIEGGNEIMTNASRIINNEIRKQY